ncbi:MAG: methyltransferase domain-containing protein [Candidatus Omnitrophica bacterium]|nr:methyltransferase domain-containing protein [Candidatus Omnitrophota bacterium]
MCLTPLAAKAARQKFARAAGHYDEHAAFHRALGCDLTARLGNLPSGAKVLDAGMGTGSGAAGLAEKSNGVWVAGCDAAWPMAAAAKKRYPALAVCAADVQALPFAGEVFDAVVSNLALQWAPDLTQAFGGIFRVLKKGGRFTAAVCAEHTLEELFTALTQTALDRSFAWTRLRSLADIRTIGEAIPWARWETSAETREIRFSDLNELLRWVKGLGANGLNPPYFLGRRHLALADQYYRTRFPAGEGIRATMEIIWIEAVK